MVNNPLIASNNDIRAVLECLYGKESIHIVSADSAFRFELVKHEQGISVVPAFYEGAGGEGIFDFSGLKKVPLKDPYYLEIGFALPASVENNKYIEQFFIRLNTYYLGRENTAEFTLLVNELTKTDDSNGAHAFIGSAGLHEADRHRASRLGPSGESREGTEQRDECCGGCRRSPRERDVFELMVQGKSTSEISESLYISRATTKSHMSSIYKKLGVHSREEMREKLTSFAHGVKG